MTESGDPCEISVENVIAELIAEDMRDLELQDAAANSCEIQEDSGKLRTAGRQETRTFSDNNQASYHSRYRSENVSDTSDTAIDATNDNGFDTDGEHNDHEQLEASGISGLSERVRVPQLRNREMDEAANAYDAQRESNDGNDDALDEINVGNEEGDREAEVDVHNNNAPADRDNNNIAESDNPETGNAERVEETEEKRWTENDVLKLLIRAINYRSPLKDIDTVLKWELDVNKPFKNGLCAMHYAAYTNYVSCVNLLLEKGANVNVIDDIGYTPLHLAARCGHVRMLRKLIENGAMINFNEPGVEIKIDEINKLGYTTTEPVNLAIQNNHAECVEVLLENGARWDNKYFMGHEISLAPLEDVRCLEILLKHGANPNVFNRCGLSPLMKACKDHHIDAVRLLLKHGADYNAQCPPLFERKSVLQIAIASGNIVIINLLLAKKPKISRNEDYKYTALHTAIIKGRADICRLLLQNGANPEEKTDEGATPLMIACSAETVKDRKEIVNMLIQCGANVNAFGHSYSYLDPYLSPLTEYLKHVGNAESFSIVECLVSNEARIHYTTGDKLVGGRRDPFAILPYAHCMENYPEILKMTIKAAQRFSPIEIHAADNLSEDMKNTLLLVATQPQDLKHIVRLFLRRILVPGLHDKVNDLPVPPLLKSYLLFKW